MRNVFDIITMSSILLTILTTDDGQPPEANFTLGNFTNI